MNVLLVDVCHTLYDANTTYGFLDRFLKHNPQYARLVKRRKSILERVRSRLLPGQDIIRQQALAMLEGETLESLVASAKDYVLTLPQITPVQNYVRQQQASGVSVFLVSSSLDFVVEAIAKDLNTDGWFASKLKFENDFCTGLLELDLTGSKDTVIREAFNNASNIEFISDNFSDANCIPFVQSFRPVYPRRSLRAKAFWYGKKVGEPIYG